MQHGQDGLLVHPGISGGEAVNVLGRPDATLIGLLKIQRQQRLHLELVKEREHAQTASLELSQPLLLLLAVGVGGAGIQEGGDQVEGLAGSEAAVVAQAGVGADKVHAFLSMKIM